MIKINLKTMTPTEVVIAEHKNYVEMKKVDKGLTPQNVNLDVLSGAKPLENGETRRKDPEKVLDEKTSDKKK